MQPSVVFIDEIDSLLTARTDGEMDAVRRIKTEFFVQLDGAGTDMDASILVIGTTNRPEQLDEAARRRFVKRLYVPLPGKAARKQLIERIREKEKKMEVDEQEMEEVLLRSKGYSCADMTALLKEVTSYFKIFQSGRCEHIVIIIIIIIFKLANIYTVSMECILMKLVHINILLYVSFICV